MKKIENLNSPITKETTYLKINNRVSRQSLTIIRNKYMLKENKNQSFIFDKPTYDFQK